ncbi:hypothetical protein B0J13DRAFT_460020 [Dactylonectria estremocensis]|uniref:Uncharacterized protein n=1 Tax=Dactylonectria estremocensis TaxID=1079267 RepID=A0A9P9D991_9HYPO|nr:hypothetical protein B0J13DRAFT_460020 [Dactylonectria estremocensis]
MDGNRINGLVARANIHNLAIHTFGLGLAHDPDSLVDLASRTKATYTYVKDWMALPECLMGGMQLVQRQLLPNVRLRLRLLHPSPAVFTSVEGAHLVTNRASGREKSVSLGNLGLHDERDIIVHMEIEPNIPHGDWYLGGRNSLTPANVEARHESDESANQGRHGNVLSLFQVEMTWADINNHHILACQPDPVVVRLSTCSNEHLNPPAMLFHFNMVQRQAELFTANLLSRALGWSSAGHFSEARLLLANAYQALQQLLGADSTVTSSPTCAVDKQPRVVAQANETVVWNGWFANQSAPLRFASSRRDRARLLNKRVVVALLAEIQDCWEWIEYPEVFHLDSRKRALQAIGILSFQRALGRQSPLEAM